MKTRLPTVSLATAIYDRLVFFSSSGRMAIYTHIPPEKVFPFVVLEGLSFTRTPMKDGGVFNYQETLRLWTVGESYGELYDLSVEICDVMTETELVLPDEFRCIGEPVCAGGQTTRLVDSGVSYQQHGLQFQYKVVDLREV